MRASGGKIDRAQSSQYCHLVCLNFNSGATIRIMGWDTHYCYTVNCVFEHSNKNKLASKLTPDPPDSFMYIEAPGGSESRHRKEKSKKNQRKSRKKKRKIL